MDEKMKEALIAANRHALAFTSDLMSDLGGDITPQEIDLRMAVGFLATIRANGFDVTALAAAEAVDGGEWNAAIEAAAAEAEGFEKNRDWVPGSLYDTLRRETAAAIRKLKRTTP